MNSLLNSDVGEQPEPGTKCYGSTVDLGGNIFPVRQKGVVTKRPGWVWLICIVNCCAVCLTMRLFYLIFSGSIPLIPLDAVMVAINAAIIVIAVSYTHLRAHETDSYLVCRLLL